MHASFPQVVVHLFGEAVLAGGVVDGDVGDVALLRVANFLEPERHRILLRYVGLGTPA
jgi:hypothetical protein